MTSKSSGRGTKTTAERKRFRIIFQNQGQTYEIYAKNVTQGALFGFVEAEGLLFGQRSQVVVDPSEESLKQEFADVTRIHVPLHSVVRIDEVEKEGASRITSGTQGTGSLTAFPGLVYQKPPAKDPEKP